MLFFLLYTQAWLISFLERFIANVRGGPKTLAQLPADPRRHRLGLSQQTLLFQLKHEGRVSIELGIQMTSGRTARLVISTAFSSINPTALHVQAPLDPATAHGWMLLLIGMDELLQSLPGSNQFQCCNAIEIKSSCSLRKVFTLPGSSEQYVDGYVHASLPILKNR